MLAVLAHPFFSLRLTAFLFVLFILQVVAGQTLINGQIFTNGLSIIDSPPPSNPAHAGSPISIAVDVSGDGRLQAPDGIDALDIYLVSNQHNINITVTDDPNFLSGESGSVKHLNWVVPLCLPAGDYNLTFYESSQFNKSQVFAITPLPIPVSNPKPSGDCSNSSNALLSQPQPANPLSQSPFAPGSSLKSSGSPTSFSLPSSSGMVTVYTSSADLETLTLTISGGVIEIPTVTVTSQVTPSPTTVVLISMATVTDTIQGTPTTFTEESTFTTVVTAAPSKTTSNPNSNTSNDNTSGFLPVNAASHLFRAAPLYYWLLIGALFGLM